MTQGFFGHSASADEALNGVLDRSTPMPDDVTAWLRLLATVNSLDPVGLMTAGTPEDEYESEVADLVRLAERGRLTPDTAWAVFVQWSSEHLVPDRNDPCWQRIATVPSVGEA